MVMGGVVSMSYSNELKEYLLQNGATICVKCIEVYPYTQNYIKGIEAN